MLSVIVSAALHVFLFWTTVALWNWAVLIYKPVRTPNTNLSRIRRLSIVWLIIATILNICARLAFSWFMGATSAKFTIVLVFIFANNRINDEYWKSLTFFNSKWYGKYFTTAPMKLVPLFTCPYAFLVLALTLVPDFWPLYYYFLNV